MRLKIRDYKRIREVDLPLSGLVGLVGPNGSGKSTIVQALRSLMYNVAGDTVRWGATTSAIGLGLEKSIIWRRTPAGASYVFNKQTYEKLGRTVPPEIEKLVNMAPVEVDNEKHFVNFFAQLDAPLVIKLSPSRLYSLIVKSLDADKIELAIKNSERGVVDTREDAKELETKERIYKQDREKIEQVLQKTAELDDWNDSMVTYEETTSRLKYLKTLSENYQKGKKASQMFARVSRALEVVTQYHEQSKAIDEVSKRILILEALKERYQSIDVSKMQDIAQLLAECDEVISEQVKPLTQLIQMRDQYVSLTKQVRRHRAYTKIIAKLDELPKYPESLSKLTTLQNTYAVARERVTQLQTVVENLEHLSSGTVCPLCGQGIHKEKE